MEKRWVHILLISSFIGAILSGILIAHHNDQNLGLSIVNAICGKGNTECQKINQLSFSELLGLPVAFWGFVFYGALFAIGLIFIFYREYLLIQSGFVLACAGLLADFMLFLYGILVLNAICNMCVLTYVMTVGVLVSTINVLKDINKKASIGWLPSFSKGLSNISLVTVVLVVLLLGPGFGGIIHAYTKTSGKTPDELMGRAISLFYKEYDQKDSVWFDLADTPVKGSSDPIISIVRICRLQMSLLFDYE